MNREPGAGGLSDVAMLILIGGVAVAGLLVWLWGGLAGALFGRGWPALSAGDLLGVLTRLPARVADPAAAWPGTARARLPGPGGCYTALALIAGLVTPISVVLLRPGLVAMGRRRPGGARWAGANDLRVLRERRGGQLTGRRRQSSVGRHHSAVGRHHSVVGRRRSIGSRPAVGVDSRLTLGCHRGHLLHAERRHALIAFGPPQSGKSSGLAIPALLEWAGPAVASSIKTDLLAATISRRKTLGATFVFDPFSLAGVPSHTWSPLHSATTWDGALEVAWRLAAAGEIDQRGVEGGDFWAIAAQQRLAPLLYAAAATGGTIETVVRWAYGQGTRGLDEALMTIDDTARDARERADAHAAHDAVRAFDAQADRTRSSIEATAQSLLHAYRFSRVAASARSCEITADRLLDEAATLYLIGDAKASKLLRPIFLALLSEVVDRAYERATLAGGQLELPLLLCLDEAGNVAPLPNLAEIASTAPSHNIQLVSIFHDLQQARTRYRRQAETVVNSHRARMLLPGVADLETLRYFAGLIGEEETREHTRTTGAGGTTRSTAPRRRPLVAAEALRQLEERHALLLYGRLAPTQVRLRMWFEDRRLRRLAGQ
jgi:type IV secretion system protein VirD4